MDISDRNKNVSQTSKVVENTPATLSFITPMAGTTFNASSSSTPVNVTGACSEEGLEIRLEISDSVGVVRMSSTVCLNGTFSTQLDISTLQDGNLRLSGRYHSITEFKPLIQNYAKDTVPPSVSLPGPPASFVNLFLVNTMVVGELGATEYQWKIEDSSGSGCQTAVGYSASTSILEPILFSTVPLADGTIRLCLRGIDAAGNIQALNNAFEVSWIKSTVTLPPGFSSELVIIEAPYQLVLESQIGAVDLFVSANSATYDEMYITNTSGCGAGGVWEPYNALKSGWILEPTQENSTASVYVKFRKGTSESSCVSDTIYWQRVYNHCGGVSASSAAQGIIEDSGGASGTYGDADDCSFTINATEPIVLETEMLNLAGMDFLSIFDGDSSTGTLIGSYQYWFSGVPSAVTANSGTMTIVFKALGSSIQDGYRLRWRTQSSSVRALSSFVINNGSLGTTSSNVTLSFGTPQLPEMYVTYAAGCASGGVWEPAKLTREWDLGGSVVGYESVYVKYRDAYGNETRCGEDIILFDPSTPMTLTTPLTFVKVASDHIEDEVGKVTSSFLASYRYKLGDSGTTDCSNGTGYSTSRDVSERIYIGLESMPFTSARLCVVSTNLLGVEQSYAAATVISWDLGALPIKVQFATTGQWRDEDDVTNVSVVVKMNHPKPFNVTIGYDVQGTAQFGVDHNLSPGSVVIPAGSVSQTISFQSFGNTLASADKSINLSLHSIAEGGALGFRSTHGVVLADNDSGPRKTILDVSVGRDHGCLIYSNNDLYCWGVNNSSQFGNGTKTPSPTPLFISSGYKKVVAGFTHTCGIKTDDKLYCWGDNYYGQIGIGNTTTPQSMPQPVDPGETYLSVGLGDKFTCAITTNKKLKCWGVNNRYQLGLGTTVTQSSPQPVDATHDYAFIGTGGWRSLCGIRDDDKRIYCWGGGSENEMGMGWELNSGLTPTLMDPMYQYQSVSVGSFGSCGITMSNDLRCWGPNYGGETGVEEDYLAIDSDVPRSIEIGTKYLNVSMGAEATNYEPAACGVTLSGSLKCWGSDIQQGVLGLGNRFDWVLRVPPTEIDPGFNYQKVFAGHNFSCGWLTTGELKCWGSPEEKVIAPRLVPLAKTLTKVSGSTITTCVTNSAQKVFCAGIQGAQLNATYFSPIDSSESYKQIETGFGAGMGCGLTVGGVIKCWGRANTNISSQTPPTLGTLTLADNYLFKQFSYSGSHICGITLDSELFCWGRNLTGQLGNNSLVSTTNPQPIDVSTTYKKIATYNGYSCGITTSGQVKCWGGGASGNLGYGINADSMVPVAISDANPYVEIATGGDFACGIRGTGQLRCWGSDVDGKLGNGAGGSSSVPVDVDVGETYQKISLGEDHGCGITTAGVLKCWGSNSPLFTRLGALGVGSTSSTVVVPTPVTGGNTFKDISAVDIATCGVTTDGELYCWGMTDWDFSFSQIHTGLNSSLPNFMMGVTHP